MIRTGRLYTKRIKLLLNVMAIFMTLLVVSISFSQSESVSNFMDFGKSQPRESYSYNEDGQEVPVTGMQVEQFFRIWDLAGMQGIESILKKIYYLGLKSLGEKELQALDDWIMKISDDIEFWEDVDIDTMSWYCYILHILHKMMQQKKLETGASEYDEWILLLEDVLKGPCEIPKEPDIEDPEFEPDFDFNDPYTEPCFDRYTPNPRPCLPRTITPRAPTFDIPEFTPGSGYGTNPSLEPVGPSTGGGVGKWILIVLAAVGLAVVCAVAIYFAPAVTAAGIGFVKAALYTTALKAGTVGASASALYLSTIGPITSDAHAEQVSNDLELFEDSEFSESWLAEWKTLHPESCGKTVGTYTAKSPPVPIINTGGVSGPCTLADLFVEATPVGLTVDPFSGQATGIFYSGGVRNDMNQILTPSKMRIDTGGVIRPFFIEPDGKSGYYLTGWVEETVYDCRINNPIVAEFDYDCGTVKVIADCDEDDPNAIYTKVVVEKPGGTGTQTGTKTGGSAAPVVGGPTTNPDDDPYLCSSSVDECKPNHGKCPKWKEGEKCSADCMKCEMPDPEPEEEGPVTSDPDGNAGGTTK